MKCQLGRKPKPTQHNPDLDAPARLRRRSSSPAFLLVVVVVVTVFAASSLFPPLGAIRPSASSSLSNCYSPRRFLSSRRTDSCCCLYPCSVTRFSFLIPISVVFWLESRGSCAGFPCCGDAGCGCGVTRMGRVRSRRREECVGCEDLVGL